MKTVLIESLSGLFLFLVGFIAGYTYFTNRVSPLFLGLAGVCIIAGIYLFVSAVRQNNIAKQLAEAKDQSAAKDTVVIDATHEKSMLERNNEIMNDWSKTFETKEKLKMLKIAASAAEEESKHPSA